jgi:hypothetical protein
LLCFAFIWSRVFCFDFVLLCFAFHIGLYIYIGLYTFRPIYI